MQLKRNIPLYFILLLGILVAGCAPASTPAPTEVPPTPTPLTLPTTAPVATTAPAATVAPTATTAQATAASDELTGAALFQLSCASCHGADRAGNKFTKEKQTIETPSLAWTELTKTYSTNPGRGSVPDQVALSITKGQDETGADLNTMMPRWSSLSQAQIDSLVQFLQTAGTTTVASATLTPAGMNLQGEQLYKAACASCHGTDGAGSKFTKENQTIETPSLHWGELTKTYSANPNRGSVADQVALSITKGQDETGADLNTMMPRWSFLSKDQVDSLIQYLQSAFK